MKRPLMAIAIVSLLVPVTFAQDSVSKTGSSSDAIVPWDDAGATNGSEQGNAYVVDLQTITTDWNSQFGVAPIIKSGKSSSTFTGSLISGQTISRKVIRQQDLSASSYDEWSTAGAGVNNDPTINDPGTAIDTSDADGAQFAAAFAEFGTTDQSATYGGVVTGICHIDPSDTTRLYVNRIQSCVNGVDDSEGMATIQAGNVTETGVTVFRADNFGAGGPGTSLPPAATIAGNNYFMIDALGRSTTTLNIINNSSTLFDGSGTTTKWGIVNSGVTHAMPNVLPASVSGGADLFVGANWNGDYVRGVAGSMTSDNAWAACSGGSERGNAGYTTKSHGSVSSTHGTAGVLRYGTSGFKKDIGLFGLDASAGVTGTQCITLPGSLSDGTFLITDAAGGHQWEFGHHDAAVSLRGGPTVAMNVVGTDLVVAAEMDYPTSTGSTHPTHAIPVARVTPGGATTWTLAAYNDSLGIGGATAGEGKPILDGPSPGGLTIGHLVPFGSAAGMSAPMIDAAGNVWFLSGYQLTGGLTDVGLFRSVWNGTGYDLELVLSENDVVAGPNSGLDYEISFIKINDGSSAVSGGTAWGANISEDAFLGYNDYTSLFTKGTEDERNLGGLVINASITYDNSLDSTFDPLTQSDENYNVLLYVAPVAASGVREHGTGCAGTGGVIPRLKGDGMPNNSAISFTVTVEDGVGGGLLGTPGFTTDGSVLLFVTSAAGFISGGATVQGPCKIYLNPAFSLVDFLPVTLPGTIGAAGAGTLPLPTTTTDPGLAPGTVVYLQMIIVDNGVNRTFSMTNALELTF